LEQLLTEDVHRATCIKYVAHAGPTSSYGNCAGNEASSDFFEGQCTGAASNVLCIGWPDTTTECGMALYSLSTTPASRSAGVIGSLATTDYAAVRVTSSPPADTWRSNGLQVSVTVAAPNLLSTSVQLVPLAADPWGSGTTC
jgi:hypothetical protein